MTQPIASLQGLDIATPLMQWQLVHGRHHLPWQQTRDPYRVWLSEIMLQQTQVATVLGYYPRFLERFADVRALAAASVDDVLAVWSGLGYYSRARNLHRCALQVVSEYGGVFPRSAALLEQLPGIGRSSAAAIAAFCFGERTPILDANVRRVLTRVLAFGADVSQVRHQRQLWAYAHALLPQHDGEVTMPRYTQGLMDLGATVCLARMPQCQRCPLHQVCAAAQAHNPQNYPVRTRTTARATQSWWVMVYRRVEDGAFWLQRRPATGIWAGLYAPAMSQYTSDSNPAMPAIPAMLQVASVQHLTSWVHKLTHRDWHLYPVVISLSSLSPLSCTDAPTDLSLCDNAGWYAPEVWPTLGLPAPVRRLLEQVQSPTKLRNQG